MAARRGYGDGSIIERKDRAGTVTGYQVQVRLPNGKRKTLGTVKTRREAGKLARQGQADVAVGRLVTNPRQTVAEYLAGWLGAKRLAVRYKTAVTYRTNIAHACRHIGHVQLDAVRPVHIEQCEAALLAEGKGKRTVQQVHTRLHAAFQRAVKLDLIGRNPCDPVIPPRPAHHERPILSLEQAAMLFDATRGDWLHALYVTLATAGLRLGEALGLTWEDVDLDAQTITLRQAQQRQTGKGLVLDELKTAKSRRVVPLMAITVDALREQRVRQRERRVSLGSEWSVSGRVFTSGAWTPLDPANVRRRYYPTLQREALPRVTLHDLRHTAASIMAAEGVPTHMIQAVLGHANSSTTMNIYTHVLPVSLGTVRDRMNAAFTRVREREIPAS